MGGGGCWNISFVHAVKSRHPDGQQTARPPAGMPSCSCDPSDTATNDLLAGMMQRVVAAVMS